MKLKLKVLWKSCFSSPSARHLFVLLYLCGNSVPALIIQAKSPCDNTELNGFKGTITSPNYPSPYLDEVDCEWKIRSPSNSALKITILDLDISEDENCPRSPCCSRHRLTISREEGTILLCGNSTLERTITVFQPLTSIKYFSSGENKRGRGFRMVYSVDVHTCKPNERPCLSGRCYPMSSFCNGINDCGDGSDEMYCLHMSHTSRYDIRKIMDHERSTLEMQETCKEGSVKCPFSPGHCYYPITDVCDGKFDCPKGEDEVSCVPECPKQIACSSGDGCYYPVQRCNSIRNCRDNSDETGCPLEPCVPLQFTCLNGACISGSAICDGDDDCGDLSDEENCTKSSFMKAAVVGLLTCIMLFCIVLGCMYHVYTARLRASANLVQQLETEPSDDDFIYREPPPAYSVAVNDPRVISYPASDVTERFFDSDHSMRFQRGRAPRRARRRQNSPGNSDSPSPPMARRPSYLGPRGGSLNGGSAGGGSDTQVQPKTSNATMAKRSQDRPSRSGYHRHLDLCGFGSDQILPTNSCRRNDSPCSSPSLSPSRESITSCTTLEEIEDLVSLFHH